MKTRHTTLVFGPDGSTARSHATFERGDKATQEFAKMSSLAMRDGGVSIAISGGYTMEAIKSALQFLEKIGD